MGKGDTTRPVNKEKFDEGFERVFGEKILNNAERQYPCPRCGATFWWEADPLFDGKNRCDNCGNTWTDTPRPEGGDRPDGGQPDEVEQESGGRPDPKTKEPVAGTRCPACWAKLRSLDLLSWICDTCGWIGEIK